MDHEQSNTAQYKNSPVCPVSTFLLAVLSHNQINLHIKCFGIKKIEKKNQRYRDLSCEFLVSDDSYMYQLSLVVATATAVSFPCHYNTGLALA